jgi:hypothetical protein
MGGVITLPELLLNPVVMGLLQVRLMFIHAKKDICIGQNPLLSLHKAQDHRQKTYKL